MDRQRPRWRDLDEDDTVFDVRIDGFRRPEPTQAIRGDQVDVVIQLPVRSHKGRTNILMTAQIAAQIGEQLCALSTELMRSKEDKQE